MQDEDDLCVDNSSGSGSTGIRNGPNVSGGDCACWERGADFSGADLPISKCEDVWTSSYGLLRRQPDPGEECPGVPEELPGHLWLYPLDIQETEGRGPQEEGGLQVRGVCPWKENRNTCVWQVLEEV